MRCNNQKCWVILLSLENWQLDEQEELLQQIFNHRQITLKGKQCNSIDRYMMYSSLQCGENFCRSRNQIEVKKIGNSSFDACRHKQFSTAVGVKYLDNLTCLTGFKYLKNLKLWSRLIVFCQQQFQLTCASASLEEIAALSHSSAH